MISEEICKRLLKILKKPHKKQERIYVWSPVPLPFRHLKIMSLLNRCLFEFNLARFSKKLKMQAPLFWSYSPITMQYVSDFSKYSAVVYHCVDEIKEQPGMPTKFIEQEEQKFLSNADIVFVSSINLYKSRSKMHDNVIYYPNVVDYKHFSRSLNKKLKIPPDLQKIREKGKVIGFIGAISNYKVDFDLLKILSITLKDEQIVLIGKIGEGDPWTQIDDLKKCNNIHFLGAKKYDDLPAYLKGFDIAIQPCRINQYTKSMFPMKFFEYLAAGVAVVSTSIPAIEEFAHFVTLADKNNFAFEISRLLKNNNKDLIKHGRELASQYTYEQRTIKMLNDIAGILKEKA